MAIQAPLRELPIATADSGFYTNFNKLVALASKIIIALLVVWAAIFPDKAGEILGAMRSWSFANLNYCLLYTSPSPRDS